MSLRLALIGHPVQHSLSPPLHRAAFSYFGLKGSYELIDVTTQELESTWKELIAKSFSGWNVTVPHKEAAYLLLSQNSASCSQQESCLSPEAKLVKAVNTVRLDSHGKLYGHNTDLPGFYASLQKQRLALGQAQQHNLARAVILGAGGAARACLGALIRAGYQQVIVLARDKQKASWLCTDLAQSWSAATGSAAQIELSGASLSSADLPEQASLVVNCTPVGLKHDDLVLSGFDTIISAMTTAPLFIDTVYSRGHQPTLLCRRCQLRWPSDAG